MAKRKAPEKKIWPVEHPITQYKEDVKEIAMKNGWRIVDARFCKNIKPSLVAENTPKLSKIDKKKQAEAHQTAAASQAGIGAGAPEAEASEE